MDLDLADTGPATGRYVLPLTARWAAAAIAPWPGMVVLALLLDGEPVEVLADPADVAGYLHGLPERWVGGPVVRRHLARFPREPGRGGFRPPRR